MSISLTVIRHGESTDNTKSLWAGHRDAPLSNHGMNQAGRLGAAFADIPITAIYASDLKRATQTAQAIHTSHASNRSQTPPPLFRTPLLREQCFGSSEGQPWTSPFADPGNASTTFAARRARRFSGADGESQDDVGERAERFVEAVVVPWLHRAASPPEPAASSPVSVDATAPHPRSPLADVRPIHIVVVAHGIFLSELLRHLLIRAQGPSSIVQEPARLGGFANTGWTRLEVALHPSASPQLPPTGERNLFTATAIGTGSTRAGDPPHWPAPPTRFPARFSLPPPPPPSSPSPFALSDDARPILTNGSTSHVHADDLEDYENLMSANRARLIVRITQLNNSAHLAGLKRQGGGIGSAAFDKDQKTLKSFFGGGGGV